MARQAHDMNEVKKINSLPKRCKKGLVAGNLSWSILNISPKRLPPVRWMQFFPQPSPQACFTPVKKISSADG
jgi:hypothetical protein